MHVGEIASLIATMQLLSGITDGILQLMEKGLSPTVSCGDRVKNQQTDLQEVDQSRVNLKSSLS